MSEIIPAILEKNFNEIEKKVRIISKVSSWVQIDVVDGVFAPNKTWPFLKEDDPDLKKLVHEEISLPEWESVSYEFDLMIANPRAAVDTFVTAGASRIVVHFDAFKNNNEREVFLKDFKKKYNLPEPLSVELGLAIGTDNDVADLLSYMIANRPILDFVQFMGIDHVGSQGQIFNEKTFERIAEIRKSLPPDLTITVDGGVKEEHLERLVEAGADRIVVGSAIFNTSDPVREFEKLCDKIGA